MQKPWRLYITIILLCMVILAGCSGKSGGGKTGLAYIKAEAGQTNNQYGTPREKQDRVSAASPKKEEDKSHILPGRRVFLTFDDGPDSINTPLILDVLDTYGVKATFFVVGTNIEKDPGLLKDIVKRGHAVGNHTYNHKYSDIYSTQNSLLLSFKRNEELIYKTVGVRPHIVRDPGGRARNNTVVKNQLVQNQYRLMEWNVDSYDSRKPYQTAPQIIESIRNQLQNKKLWPNMIILMHDSQGHINTARALPTIIEMLQSQGFRFETLK